MAIYKLATGVSRILGSRGGVTFQRSGSNFAIRNRKKPFPRRNERTSKSRSAFHNVQSNYRTLSLVDKTSWSDDSPSFPRTDSLGNSYQLTGPQLFNAHNAPLVNEGLSIIDTSQAPISFPFISFVSSAFSVSSSSFQINLSSGDPLSDFIFQVFVSPILDSPPDLQGEGADLLIKSKSASSPFSIDIFNEYRQQFGDLSNAAGRWIAWRVRSFSKSTGQVEFNNFNNQLISS